jgi:hypothetical protein
LVYTSALNKQNVDILVIERKAFQKYKVEKLVVELRLEGMLYLTCLNLNNKKPLLSIEGIFTFIFFIVLKLFYVTWEVLPSVKLGSVHLVVWLKSILEVINF